MGWCGGGQLAANIWNEVRDFIPLKLRMEVGREIINLFEKEDCDTIHEAEVLCEDALYWKCIDCGELLMDNKSLCEVCEE